MLESEWCKVDFIRASQSDFSEMEEELKTVKANRKKLSQQIDEILIEINKQEGAAS